MNKNSPHIIVAAFWAVIFVPYELLAFGMGGRGPMSMSELRDEFDKYGSNDVFILGIVEWALVLFPIFYVLIVILFRIFKKIPKNGL